MSKDLFRDLFQNYVRALQFKMKYFNKKLDWSKYVAMHREMLAELDAASGTQEEQFDIMKLIDNRYFKAIRTIIFDIPFLNLNYHDAEDMGLPIEARVNDYFMQETPVLPLNYMGGFEETSYDFFNLFMKMFSSKTRSAIGGKDPGAKFANPITKKFYLVIQTYYNIITHKVPRESTRAWKVLKSYTDIFNNLEKEYKSPKGQFSDYTGENKKKKFVQKLEKNTMESYKEFNYLAVSLQ